MLNILSTFLFVIVFFTLFETKSTIGFWYRRLKLRIWHFWIIWKIEKQLPTNSIVYQNVVSE